MQRATHQANPVLVSALVIRGVTGTQQGAVELTLEDGTEYRATSEMISRHRPQSGDYLVCQEDGYIYINPKDVFERKYSAIKPA